MLKGIFFFIALKLILTGTQSWAAFSNYNSILVGEKAAGMGGAFTALSGDPAACSYYNPATLARMEGATLSAAVSVYNKYETHFGDTDDFSQAPLRVNQGAFVPIPSSSGSVYTFRNFAVGLSIVIPDSNTYSGEIASDGGNVTLLNIQDQSLWVGGTLGLNLTESDAIGLTMYYTSRDYLRSVTDRVDNGNVSITNQEKTLTNNSIIYILGYFYQMNPRWSLGLSHRFSSLEVSGKGTYFTSEVSTTPTESTLSEQNILSNTSIPSKTTLGFAYELPKFLTLALDFSFYDSEKYLDLNSTIGGGDSIRHVPTWNVNFGGEYYLRSWLGLRFGLFTNYASSPELKQNLYTQRQADHVDMWGFSANAAIYTSSSSSFTFGGYYTGGQGHSTQLIQGQIQRIRKTHQVFAMLIGTTFRF